MAVTSTPIFPQSVQNAGLAVVNATSTTITTFFSAGTNGSKVDWINMETNDTAANNVTFYLYNGTTSYPLTTVQAPAGAGATYNNPSVAVFGSQTQTPFLSYDSNGNKFLYLQSGWSLQVSVLAAVTSGKQLTITAQYENY